jgi:hypothetical protein
MSEFPQIHEGIGAVDGHLERDDCGRQLRSGYWIHYAVHPGTTDPMFVVWEIREAGNVKLTESPLSSNDEVESRLVQLGADPESAKARVQEARKRGVALVVLRRPSLPPTVAEYSGSGILEPDIGIDEVRRLIRIEFDPKAGVQDWRSSQPAVVRLAKDKGIRRVLVDVREQESVNSLVLEMFNFAVAIPTNLAIAVLSEPHRSDHLFVETVAINRAKSVKLFFGPEEEAIGWLMSAPEAAT